MSTSCVFIERTKSKIRDITYIPKKEPCTQTITVIVFYCTTIAPALIVLRVRGALMKRPFVEVETVRSYDCSHEFPPSSTAGGWSHLSLFRRLNKMGTESSENQAYYNKLKSDSKTSCKSFHASLQMSWRQGKTHVTSRPQCWCDQKIRSYVDCFHVTSRQPFGVPKQWNGGHVCVPDKSSRNWTQFLCKRFLLFWLKNMLHSSVGRASHRYPKVTGSNPVEALIFFRLLPSDC